MTQQDFQNIPMLEIETQSEAMGYAEERAKLFAACRDYRAQLDIAQQEIARLREELAPYKDTTNGIGGYIDSLVKAKLDAESKLDKANVRLRDGGTLLHDQIMSLERELAEQSDFSGNMLQAAARQRQRVRKLEAENAALRADHERLNRVRPWIVGCAQTWAHRPKESWPTRLVEASAAIAEGDETR